MGYAKEIEDEWRTEMVLRAVRAVSELKPYLAHTRAYGEKGEVYNEALDAAIEAMNALSQHFLQMLQAALDLLADKVAEDNFLEVMPAYISKDNDMMDDGEEECDKDDE